MSHTHENALAGQNRIAWRRWSIATMLFFAAGLNYIDRQTLSILAPSIQSNLGMDERQYAHIASLFLATYAASLLVSGRLIDKLGTRLGMSLFVGFWSLANMATGFARSAASLGAFRAMLGLGEAGNWPGSIKAVSEWFPASQRGAAIGCYTMGATVGATIAPLLIVALAGRWGWQAAFVAPGAAGLLWILPWWLLYRPPEPLNESPSDAVKPSATDPWPSEWSRWRAVLNCRLVWLLMVTRLLTDPVWYFYQFWMAKYLFSARGLNQESLGIVWVIFLAADAGSLLGGVASGWLIRRGAAPTSARMRIMLLCACVTPLSPLVAMLPTVLGALAVAMVIVLAHMAWLVNVGTILVDLIPGRLVATVFGVVATGSAIGGILMNQAVGELVTHYSYTYCFALMALPHPIAWFMLWKFGIGRHVKAPLTDDHSTSRRNHA